MRTPSLDNIDLHKDIVAIIPLLSYFYYKGILVGLFERLKSIQSGNWRKPSQRQKESDFP